MPVTDREEQAIVSWVADRFMDDLDIDVDLAVELALAHRDWHEVAELIAAGCDPQLAGRIVL